MRGIAFDDVYNDLFFQRVVFGTVFLQLGDVLLECTHFLLITQYFDDITAGNDAKLGIQGLYQLADGKEAAGYNVYVDGVKLNKELLTEASCGLTNLKAETTYFVEVTAVDAAGNESVKSEKVTFKTLKAEEQKEDSTPENNEKPGAVQTGDHANVFVWMIGLLISASAAVAVMFKRNKNR